MIVELPRSSTDFLRQATAHAVRRSTGTRAWWILGVAVVIGTYAPVIVLAPTSAPWTSIPWVLAPLVALVGWAEAARRTDESTRLACRVLAVAAVAGLVTQVVWAFEMHVLARRGVPYAAYLLSLQYVLLAAGTWLVLRRRGRSGSAGVTADALLVLLAGLVVVLRVVMEPLLESVSVGPSELMLVASLQTLSLVPVFFAALVVLRRSAALPPASAAALLAASLAFVAGGMLSLSRLDPQPFTPGDPFDYVWLLAWLLLGFSGFAARTVAPTAPAMLRDRMAYEGVRRMIVPAAALFLAVGVVDVALRPARPETIAAIALLGAMLAIRTAHAFSLTDREEERKRQLAYTRALLEVTHSLSEATDLDTTLSVIVQSARSVVGARAAGIELITDDGETLETRAAIGLPADIVGTRFPVRGSFTGWVVRHGQPRTTANPLTDPYIQPQSLHFLGRSPVAAAPIRFRGETTGALYTCIREEPFDAEELAFLGAMAEQAAIAIERARLFDQVSVLSVTDPLTGLANRRSLQREIEREFAAARRGRELVAVIFDLDEFKGYNDCHGHLAGDEALQAFARALGDETRAMNLAARYGGDEFVALLSETRLPGGRAFVERVRVRFDAATRALGRGTIGFSAGVASFDPGMADADALLRAADEDLYRQKPRERV